MSPDDRSSRPQPPAPPARLEEVIAEYLEAVESDEQAVRAAFLARHPDLADHLRAFFAAQDAVPIPGAMPAIGTAKPTGACDAPTLPRGDTPTGAEFETETLLPPNSEAGTMSRGPVASPHTLTGRRFGDYELLEEIARGGMGVVYKARQVSLNRIVALKMILAGQLAGEEEVRRFYAEAKAAAHLDHPGIVPIFEVGEHDGQHYFSMGFVDGESLAARIANGPLPAKEAAELVKKIAEAVQFAHEQGVIHRDLKPGNILLDKNGDPRVTDFGLAKHVASTGGESNSNLTATGQILGTPSYMPPEQAAGKTEIGPLADIYSLGAVLYTLLTSRPPFQSASAVDTLLAVLEQEPVAPRRLNAAVPRDLETVCLKCLEKEPRKRYGTAEELGNELGRFLAGEPIKARPVGKAERAWRWCRRNPALATVASLILFIAIASPLVAIHETSLRREEAKQRREAQWQRKVSELRLAESYLERGLALCDQGDVGPGMLWMARCLEILAPLEEAVLSPTQQSASRQPTLAEDADVLERVARANLAGWRQSVSALKVPLQPHAPVQAVAFSPDGKTVVTGSADNNTARLWDAATGEARGAPLQHQDAVEAVGFSPDGTKVLTGSRDNTARLWDAVTGQSLGAPLQHQGQVSAVAFSPDGKTVLTGSQDKMARLWDAATGNPLGAPLHHRAPVEDVAFSPDGTKVLTGSRDNAARLWDAATRQPLGTPLQHQGRVSAVAFSPDSRTVLTGSFDTTARLWDAATGQPLAAQLQHQNFVLAVAFSPDGKTVLTGSANGTAQLWDAVTGTPLGTHLHHQSPVRAVAFSPDGKTVLTGSDDRTARLWHAAIGEPLGIHPRHQGIVRAVAFSPDGKTVLTGSHDKTARLWDAATREPLGAPLQHQDLVWAVAFSPDGKTVLTGSEDRTAQLWDVATGQPLGAALKHQAAVEDVAFSPDGRMLLTGSRDNTAQLWDAATGEPRGAPLQHRASVVAVAFSPDGRIVLTGSGDNTARLWDTATGKPTGVQVKHRGAVVAVAFSPDGKTVLTGSWDNTARLWDAATGQPRGSPLQHHSTVWAVAFSPDGKSVMTGSWDSTARLWDAVTGKPIGAPLQRQSTVWAVAFSPDGKTVLTGSGDNIARLSAVPQPLAGDPDGIRLWVEVLTGLELDQGGALHALDAQQWHERKRLLDGLGTPHLLSGGWHDPKRSEEQTPDEDKDPLQ